MSKSILTNLDLSKNQILNACFQNAATAPTDPKLYQYYFDTVDQVLKYWNGTEWTQVGNKGAVIFKGTVGTGGTITTLPLNNDARVGFEYMCCSDGNFTVKTGVTKAALVGDLFICTVSGTDAATTDAEWEHIPSGNDKFKGTITGDGTTTSFPITHTLNSEDVIVAVYNASKNEVVTDVTVTSASVVTIGFAIAPATTDTYTVIIES